MPVRELCTQLADLLDEVGDRRDHVTVTRCGRPAAVLVPADEHEALAALDLHRVAAVRSSEEMSFVRRNRAAALRALRQTEMGEPLAAPLEGEEAEWLDPPLR